MGIIQSLRLFRSLNKSAVKPVQGTVSDRLEKEALSTDKIPGRTSVVSLVGFNLFKFLFN